MVTVVCHDLQYWLFVCLPAEHYASSVVHVRRHGVILSSFRSPAPQLHDMLATG